MKKRILLAFISFSVLSATYSCGYFISNYVKKEKERKLSGGGTGKAFAPNYDLETVITVTGKVIKAETFVAKPMRIKSVRVFMKTEARTYEVHLGPVWYIKKQTFRLEPGDIIMVTGSLIDDKIMVQEFIKGENVFQLRTEEGQPKWFKSVGLGFSKGSLTPGGPSPNQND